MTPAVEGKAKVTRMGLDEAARKPQERLADWLAEDMAAVNALIRLRMASEAAIQRGQLKISDARRLMDHLETSLRQTTYLQE